MKPTQPRQEIQENIALPLPPMTMFAKVLEALRSPSLLLLQVQLLYLKVFVKILKASRLGYRWAVRKHQDSRPLCLYR